MATKEKFSKLKPLFGADSNGVMLLIAANAMLFIILFFTKMTYSLAHDNQGDAFFYNQIFNWFALPSSFKVFLTRPWTIITFMISHISAMAVFSNMLWLWAFGYILQDLLGNKIILPIYLYGGFFSGITFLASTALTHTSASFDFLYGAAPSVLAIVIATTTLSPSYRMFTQINGGIPLWVLTVVFVLIDLATVTSGVGFLLSHLVAGLTGFVFIHQLKKGRDWSNWMFGFYHRIDDWFNPEKKTKKTTLFYETETKPYSKTVNLTQHKLDEILDKINTKGMDSLSDEEKKFLKKASKDL